MTGTIEITFNGMKEAVREGMSIAELLVYMDERDRHVIVERNGKFVYPHEYQGTVLRPGDRIEFINPDFGG